MIKLMIENVLKAQNIKNGAQKFSYGRIVIITAY